MEYCSGQAILLHHYPESTHGSFLGSSIHHKVIKGAEACISRSLFRPFARLSGPRSLRHSNLSRHCPPCSLVPLCSSLLTLHPPPLGFHVRPVQRRSSIPTPQGLVRATQYLTYRASLGGGIIDMMNRRLRERLTEAEILQIFVDVCEGVAAMHNLRPALLHRDLKVCPLPFVLFLGLCRRSRADPIIQSFN